MSKYEPRSYDFTSPLFFFPIIWGYEPSKPREGTRDDHQFCYKEMTTVFTGTTEKASFPPDFKKVMESRSKEKSEAKWQEQRHRGSKQGHSRQMVDTTQERGWSWACRGAVSKRQSQRGVMQSQTISIPGGSVVKTLLCNAGGAGSIPSQGTKIPRAVQHGQKIKNKN